MSAQRAAAIALGTAFLQFQVYPNRCTERAYTDLRGEIIRETLLDVDPDTATRSLVALVDHMVDLLTMCHIGACEATQLDPLTAWSQLSMALAAPGE